MDDDHFGFINKLHKTHESHVWDYFFGGGVFILLLDVSNLKSILVILVRYDNAISGWRKAI
jgi:hypothetical protein